MNRTLFQLEVCHNPTDSPREWEPVADRRKDECDVIEDYHNLSKAYRCGKMFRVATADGSVDIRDFMYTHC